MKAVKFLALALAGLLGLLIVLAAAVMVNGWRIVHSRPSNRLAELGVAPDSSLRAQGEHLVRTSCAGCHSPNMQPPLSGGEEDFLAQPGMPPFGHLVAPNLTPGGRLREYSDAELARAIREGVNREGRLMLIMPSPRFHRLSDRDVAALIAFLRSQPAVTHDGRKRELSPLAYLVLGAHQFEMSGTPEVKRPQDGPPAGETPEYGEYLVSALTCQDCHGPDLHGGTKGQLPPLGPDLVALASAHTLQQFDGALRHGQSARDGHSLDPTKMPYAVYANLNDSEVAAIFALLKAGGPKP
jgi:mono/diheme cytochrome c family protein